MAKRWVVRGIWAILMAVGVLPFGRIATAEQSVIGPPPVPRQQSEFAQQQIPEDTSISSVIMSSNRRMNTDQIKARLRTQPGTKYNSAVVDEDVRELYKFNQFSCVTTYVRQDGPRKVKIFFSLREMPNTVQKVTFLGAKHIKEDDLRNLTGVKPGIPLNPRVNRQGCRKILARYEEMGRPLTDCTLVKGGDPDDTEVIYQITEGPKVKVRDIQFIGNTFVSGARLAQISAGGSSFDRNRIGGTYHKKEIENEINRLCAYYKCFGYQDVKVSVETRQSANGREVTLIYHIQEGPRYRLRDKPDVVDAPSITPREQLEALSRIKPGDYLDESKIKRDIQSITDHFDSQDRCVRVEAVPVYLPDQPGVANLHYEVQEVACRIGTIRVTGNKRLSSESILAHVSLTPGNIFFYDDLKWAEKSLAELGLFVVDAATGERPTITVLDVEGDNERKDLLITVKEKSQAKSKNSKRP